MIVVSFGDERRAGQVLDTQKQMQDAAVIDLKNSTVAVRDATGKVTLKTVTLKSSRMPWLVVGRLRVGLIRRGAFKMSTEINNKYESREEILETLSRKRDLSGANLSGLDLSEIKLTGLKMEGANLSDTNLTKATLAAINMAGVNLAKAQLNEARIAAVNLEDADLTGADLTESSWMGVNVTGANFEDATMTDAHAVAVDWSKAKVPPTQLPEPVPIPPWLPAVFAGIVMLFVVVLIAARKRKKSD